MEIVYELPVDIGLDDFIDAEVTANCDHTDCGIGWHDYCGSKQKDVQLEFEVEIISARYRDDDGNIIDINIGDIKNYRDVEDWIIEEYKNRIDDDYFEPDYEEDRYY